jgi:hypothetical protein
MKKLTLLAVLLLLTSCTRAAALIKAKIVDNAVVFEAYETGMWPFASGNPIDFNFDRLTIFSREGATWVIERRRDGQCGVRTERSLFPLTYGHVPACFTERLHAAALTPGTLYKVEAEYRGDGVFRIAQTVENPDSRQVQDDLATWPRANHPDIAYPEPQIDPGPGNRVDVPDNSNLSGDNAVLE